MHYWSLFGSNDAGALLQFDEDFVYIVYIFFYINILFFFMILYYSI